MRCSLFPTTTDDGSGQRAFASSRHVRHRQRAHLVREDPLSSRWPRSSGHQVSSSRIPCRRRPRPCPCSRSGPSRVAAPACLRQRRQHTRACSSRRPHDMSRSIRTLQAGHAQAGDARDAQADRGRGAQGRSWDAALCVRRSCLEAPQSERRRVQSFLTQVLSKCERTM